MSHMARIIAVANQKGGVGKTTTCVNVTAALKERGLSVLMADFDPQGNATSGLGVDKASMPNMYSLLAGGVEAHTAIKQTIYGDVLPTGTQLSGAEIELVALPDREYRLKNALDPLRDRYDYIMIDCPPSLGLLTLNALCAADTVMVPVQCEYYALEGLSSLMRTVRMVRSGLNPTLELEGVVLTMYDARTSLSLQVAEEVKRHFPGKLYGTVIPRSVRLSEAPSHGKPIAAYDKGGKGALAYDALAAEIAGLPAANVLPDTTRVKKGFSFHPFRKS